MARISVRVFIVSPEELESIKAAAEKAGLSMSNYLRTGRGLTELTPGNPDMHAMREAKKKRRMRIVHLMG